MHAQQHWNTCQAAYYICAKVPRLLLPSSACSLALDSEHRAGLQLFSLEPVLFSAAPSSWRLYVVLARFSRRQASPEFRASPT